MSYKWLRDELPGARHGVKWFALAALRVILTTSILLIGSVALLMGHACEEPVSSEGPSMGSTFTQSVIPPESQCVYQCADGSKIEVTTPFRTGEWFFVLGVAVMSSLPWLDLGRKTLPLVGAGSIVMATAYLGLGGLAAFAIVAVDFSC